MSWRFVVSSKLFTAYRSCLQSRFPSFPQLLFFFLRLVIPFRSTFYPLCEGAEISLFSGISDSEYFLECYFSVHVWPFVVQEFLFLPPLFWAFQKYMGNSFSSCAHKSYLSVSMPSPLDPLLFQIPSLNHATPLISIII